MNKQEKFKQEVLNGKDYERVMYWLNGQVSLFGAFMEYHNLTKEDLQEFSKITETSFGLNIKPNFRN